MNDIAAPSRLSLKAMVREHILSAMETRDGAAFEVALTAAFREGLSQDLAPILADALLASFHCRHEDIVQALQKLRNPCCVDALATAATMEHAYLEYDEFFGLARKCTWALADIGTTEARRRIEELARYPNELIAGYAQRRLDHWEELSRKGLAQTS